jgi:hypothetical protein
MKWIRNIDVRAQKLEYLIEWVDKDKAQAWVDVRDLRKCEILLKRWNMPFATQNFNFAREGYEVESILDRMVHTDNVGFFKKWLMFRFLILAETLERSVLSCEVEASFA